MLEFGYIFILWMIVAYCDLHMIRSASRQSDGAFTTPYNGVGSLPWILTGKSLSPMQYRILVPWITYILGKIFGQGNTKYMYFEIYIRLRWVGIAFALLAAHWYFALTVENTFFPLTILSLYFCLAALYDYTDIYYEIGFLAVLFGMILVSPETPLTIMLAIMLSAIAALNRETAFVAPLAALLSGHNLLFAAMFGGCVAGYLTPRIIYGSKKRYTSLIQNNFKHIKITITKERTPFVYNQYAHFAVLFVALLILYLKTWPVSPIEMATGALFLALLVPSQWREIRVFAPTVLTTIPMGVMLCR